MQKFRLSLLLMLLSISTLFTPAQAYAVPTNRTLALILSLAPMSWLSYETWSSYEKVYSTSLDSSELLSGSETLLPPSSANDFLNTKFGEPKLFTEICGNTPQEWILVNSTRGYLAAWKLKKHPNLYREVAPTLTKPSEELGLDSEEYGSYRKWAMEEQKVLEPDKAAKCLLKVLNIELRSCDGLSFSGNLCTAGIEKRSILKKMSRSKLSHGRPANCLEVTFMSKFHSLVDLAEHPMETTAMVFNKGDEVLIFAVLYFQDRPNKVGIPNSIKKRMNELIQSGWKFSEKFHNHPIQFDLCTGSLEPSPTDIATAKRLSPKNYIITNGIYSRVFMQHELDQL